MFSTTIIIFFLFISIGHVDSLFSATATKFSHYTENSINRSRIRSPEPLHANRKDDGRSGRKRRTVISSKKITLPTNENGELSNSENANVSLFKADGIDLANSEDVENVNLEITPNESKLPPISGTALAKQAEYLKKNAVERYISELFEPTPTGKEPKAVQLAKTITWGCVLLLVLVEIFVSLKVGGMPFEISKTVASP